MLKRLLACLALITGLAAISTPAQAGFAAAIAEQAQSSSQTAQPGKAQSCTCEDRRTTKPAKGTETSQCRTRTKPVTIYIPTVQFGADRAFE
ncbi:MAG: hypothetical protein H6918_13115 [Sphingomonadaceae bacterium]|nr:hypothetical protein [Sphingomonadaceae bacterium]